jgi:transmembrane sensor
MDFTNTDRPLQEAARWHARLQAGDCSEQERTAFELWRNEHPAHARAYEQAEQVAANVDRLMMTDPRMQALAARALKPSTEKRITPRWTVPAALAAGLALAVVAIQFSTHLLSPAVPTVAYDTAAQRRTVTLEDGSRVEMDVTTRIEVRMTADRREIELLEGRALFDVAHDASRPFAVTAAGARTTALGTRFQVQSESGRVLVTLAEGSVAVDDVSKDSGWRGKLVPGEQVSIDAIERNADKYTVDLQYATSWSRGRHVFRGTPLAEAIEEINRYAVRKVRLGDPSLAGLPVGGNFLTGDSELIVEALASVLPVRVVVGGSDEILLFRRYE